MKLPYPEAMFDKKFFLKHPQVYYTYRKERFKDPDFNMEIFPTQSHYFVKLLVDKDLVHKVFTQNTDDLHEKTGIEDDLLIHAHGANGKAICPVCGTPDDSDALTAALRKGEVRYCKHCTQEDGSKSPIKPGVVFFNESLPREFYDGV